MHSIAKGAVQFERKLNCEAPPCDLEQPTLRIEVRHIEVACRIHGKKQIKVPEQLVRSIANGAVQFERKLNCEAPPWMERRYRVPAAPRKCLTSRATSGVPVASGRSAQNALPRSSGVSSS